MLTNQKTLDNVELRKVDSLTVRRQLAQSERKVRGLKGKSGKGKSGKGSSNVAFFIDVEDDDKLTIALLNGTFEAVLFQDDDITVCSDSNCVGSLYHALISGEEEDGCDVLVLAVGSFQNSRGDFDMACTNPFYTLTADILLCDDSDVTGGETCATDEPFIPNSDGSEIRYFPDADDFNYVLEFTCCPSIVAP
jgi:hypothetical protein